MRLSLSGKHTGDEYALEDAIGKGSGDSGLPRGELLNDFVEAVCAGDAARTATVRKKVIKGMGEAAMIDAAAVIAAFNCYPRVADATGIPLEEAKAVATASMRAELGLDELDSRRKPGEKWSCNTNSSAP